jgi:simple sugar transport system permease protein
LFGGLLVGAQKMQRDLGVSASLITAINGIIVVFVVSSQIFRQRRQRQRDLLAQQVPTPQVIGAALLGDDA